MKIAALMVVAAALLPLSAKADGPVKVSDFPLADRIKEKVASGKPIGVGAVWDNYRGVHALNIDTCISCNLCAFSCPDICIEMVTVPGGDPKHPKKCPQIDYGKCSYCGFCSDA